MKIHSLLTGFIAMVCLAIAGFAGFYMCNNQFWGHYPLFMLMGTWTGMILIVKSLRSPNTYSLYLLSLSIASGLILAKGFVYTSPLLFFGFIPLLILQHKLDSGLPTSTWRVHWWHAFNAFMFWNIGATYWVANASLIPAIVAFMINSFFMTIPWMGMIYFGRNYPKLKYLSFIVFWICFEWVHHVWETSWPWLTLGNGLAFIPKLIQWYEITGVFGGSLWILLVNILLARLLIKKQYSISKIAIIALILVIPAAFGIYRYNTIIPKGKFIEVGIVQPNYEPHYDKFRIDQMEQMPKFEKLSRAATTPNTKYLIWPETSFEYIGTDEFDTDWRIQRMRSLIQSYPELCLVSGVTTIKTFLPGEALTDAAREGRASTYREIQNSAIQLCSNGSEIPVYVKSKLVPGVETFPYRHFLPFLKPIVDILKGSIYGLGRQKERAVFTSGSDKIAPVICYESIYGNYVGDYIRKGAEAIFIMTNDGWWDDTPGYRQHLAFGAMRAIEFRRSIARSANTGISCFIDAKGTITNETAYGMDATIIKNVLFSSVTTIYQKTGDSIAYICGFLTFLFIGMSLFKFLKARFSKNL